MASRFNLFEDFTYGGSQSLEMACLKDIVLLHQRHVMHKDGPCTHIRRTGRDFKNLPWLSKLEIKDYLDAIKSEYLIISIGKMSETEIFFDMIVCDSFKFISTEYVDRKLNGHNHLGEEVAKRLNNHKNELMCYLNDPFQLNKIEVYRDLTKF